MDALGQAGDEHTESWKYPATHGAVFCRKKSKVRRSSASLETSVTSAGDSDNDSGLLLA